MREAICGIYSITNIINNKRIIGQSKDMSQRWNDHKKDLRKNKHYNSYLQNAWNKYGESSFIYEFIYLCPESELNDREIEYIAKYNTLNESFGYNLKDGGNRPIWTQRMKDNASKYQKGRKMPPLSDEDRKKRSEARMGDRNPNFGKHRSEETKEKIRAKLKGEKSSWFGRKHSEETKQKISNTHLGSKNPQYGQKRTVEQRKFLSEKMKEIRKNKKW